MDKRMAVEPIVLTETQLQHTRASWVDCSVVGASVAEINSEDVDKHVRFKTQFNAIPLDHGNVVCYNGYQAPTLLNKTAHSLLKVFQKPRYLWEIPPSHQTYVSRHALKTTVEKLIEAGLLVSEKKAFPALFEQNETLYAWLHLTDRCNLRCSYCYLPHDNVSMTSEVGRSAIDATFRSAFHHGFRSVLLKYAGGEAMLRFDLIDELHRYAQALAKKNGLDVTGIILSNGTRLSPPVVSKIRELGLSLTISLDGPQAYNDRHRTYAGGGGSFSDVSDAIDMALENDFIPTIAVTITGQNVAGLPDLTTWLLQRDLPFRFSLCRENAYAKSFEELKADETVIISGLQKAYRVIEQNLPSRSLMDALIDRSSISGPQLRSCGAGRNYLVFDHLGQVSKCQMEKNNPVSLMQVDDPLTVLQTSSLGVQNLSVDAREGCKSCEWKYWCGGGCPILTHRATGRFDIKSPNCNIYKSLFPHAVRLEGLRLQKYGLRN